MTPKEKLHQLIEHLPDDEVQTAERFLEYLCDLGQDPFLAALARAPFDEEPETEEERQAVQEARDALARGEVITDEQLTQELHFR